MPIRFACLALSLVLLPSAASATSLSMDYLGFGVRSRNVTVTYTGVPGWVARTIRAGEINWEWNPSVPAEFTSYDSTFYSYCVDLLNTQLADDDVAIKSTNLLTVSGVPDAGGKAAWLFNTYASVVHSMPLGSGAQIFEAQNTAAGLQVAIWNAMLDTDSSISNGVFKLAGAINATVLARAQEYLTALYSGPGSTYQVSTASWLDAENVQDQIYLPGVPEPGTLLLLGTGLAGAIALRRRRKSS